MESGPSQLIAERVAHHPNPDHPALLAPETEPLSYRALADVIETTGLRLRRLGIGRNDRVALVLPNGPEMAAAFLSVSAWATAAPLNPAYRAEELAFYLDDLDARALVVLDGFETPARSVARERGIAVVELILEGEGAGTFRLEGESAGAPSADGRAERGDVALVLHTSGTTSRPKQVPLTHGNLAASASNIQRWLALGLEDRCLNVMPLFHIHGLMAALSASMVGGASVVCTPGFYAPEFFGWLRAFEPTWYTAVPTMHQAILERAAAGETGAPLRFVRSSSASLPPRVMAALEETFGCPVVEAYGMTEAAHQMTSNPTGAGTQKPGAVGLPAGPEVAIMDEAGRLLGQGETGEVVIRGANVTAGYVANPEANTSAFTDGWFRTGDEGHLDADGYLFLSGRIKELINRGGEKIAPREIDEVLLDHPAVQQATAFAAEHPRLGEEVAAAVVRAPGAEVTERQLQAFVGTRLAHFKVPRRIVFVDEVPKGPTGKLQRIGLADTLGVRFEEQAQPDLPHTPPRTPVEEVVAGLWTDVLGAGDLSVHERFLNAGGDSMLAMRLISRMRDALQIELSIVDFFDAATIADQAALVEEALLAD
jgi:acyl-CoA synthetase (AMP-forming)/AMP-acid ligase II/acyl carrier protein